MSEEKDFEKRVRQYIDDNFMYRDWIDCFKNLARTVVELSDRIDELEKQISEAQNESTETV